MLNLTSIKDEIEEDVTIAIIAIAIIVLFCITCTLYPYCSCLMNLCSICSPYRRLNGP